MANRKDFYYGQLVTQADLDEAFDYVEDADRALMVDHGFVGISQGLAVSAQGVPNLTVNVSAGAAYDQLGRRLLVGSTQVVDLTTAQPVGAGASKIVSVCIRFDRTLSDPQLDDNAVTVYVERGESFEMFLVEGAEVVGVPAAPAKPTDGLVLADVTLNQGDTQIVAGDIDSTTVGRRDWMFEISLGALPDLQVGTLLEVVTDNRQILNDHISDLTAPHAASSIALTDPGIPGAPTNLQDAWDELVSGTLGFDFANTGGYTFDAAAVLVTFDCDADFASAITCVDVTSAGGSVILDGSELRTRASGGTTIYTSTVAGQLLGQTTGSGDIITIQVPDNTAVIIDIHSVATETVDASSSHAQHVVTHEYRNGGSVTNVAVITNGTSDNTGGEALLAFNRTASTIVIRGTVTASTYNFGVVASVTYVPE